MDRKDKLLNDLMISVQKNKDIFCVSNVITEFHKVMANPDTPIDKIARVLEKDTGMTSSVLKMANSSFYGLSKRVGTVKQAISILGYKTIENIFMTQSFAKAFATQKSHVSEELWKHSLATAIAAQILTSYKQPKLSEQAFIGGLLHDMGKFILLNFKQKEMDLLLRKIEDNPFQYSISLETEILGINHQEIGAYFAQLWHFPENVTNSIKFHHMVDFSDKDKDFVACIALANNIAKAIQTGKSTSGLVELLPRWIWNTTGVNEKNINDIVNQTLDKYNALTSFMNSSN